MDGYKFVSYFGFIYRFTDGLFADWLRENVERTRAGHGMESPMEAGAVRIGKVAFAIDENTNASDRLPSLEEAAEMAAEVVARG